MPEPSAKKPTLPARCRLVLSCEHGGNQIPAEFRSLFKNATEALKSHRGYDPGALELARRFAKHFKVPLTFETRSRLLIELNRTIGHPRVFSEFSRELFAEVQQRLIDEIYDPYRERVISEIQQQVIAGPVVHVSVHSFTPVMNGKTRRTDIGLLFDPKRERESRFCSQWKAAIKQLRPDLAVYFNLPYRGTSDGFTTALRKQFPDQQYAGIELEVNQKFPLADGEDWKQLQKQLTYSLQAALDSVQ